jgi:ABC-2 type transport system ATP-binding protein
VLRDLSLWDKKKTRLGQLSGGMKRRVLIAKALSHEPSVLFLDEPTAGVDVELRQDMWRIVENLRQTGVTIILTTHYIEEAEAIADRVGVIDNGEMIVVDEKDALISKMGQKKLIIQLHEKVTNLPEELSSYELELAADGLSLSYSYDAKSSQTGITNLLQKIKDSGMKLSDLKTEQGTLEDIFVSLVNKEKK